MTKEIGLDLAIPNQVIDFCKLRNWLDKVREWGRRRMLRGHCSRSGRGSIGGWRRRGYMCIHGVWEKASMKKKKKKSGQGINGIGCFGITLIPYKGKRKNGLNGLYFYS
jgi:hypothetical protein